MEKRAARTASVMVLAFTALLYLPTVTAQPGFLSIDCGGETNYTDPENNITWTTDANYIQLGRTAEITTTPTLPIYYYFLNSTLPSYLRTVHYFPKPLLKSCYQLPAVPNTTYLLRMWFIFSTCSRDHASMVSFSLETLGTLLLFNVSLAGPLDPTLTEIIFMTSSSDVLNICFIRSEEEDYDPFVSSIELRQLLHGMYQEARPGKVLLSVERYDLGAKTQAFLRYPRDPFDRLWQSDFKLTNGSNYLKAVNTAEPISIQNAPDQPPTAVMRTALLLENANSFSLRLWNPTFGEDVVEVEHLFALYFAEIQTLKASESRNFYVAINKAVQYRSISVLNLTHGHRFSSTELKFAANEPATMSQINLTLGKTNYSTRGPMMNAFEHYVIIDSQQGTARADVEALSVVRKAFGLNEWISDPCLAVPWKGIECNRSSSTFRVSQITLSGWNLNGSIPPSIGELTEVRNMYLDNNHLMGDLPDLSNLTKLEKLHLQDNNLSGYLPHWLSQLRDLKELYLGYNHLTGDLPDLSNLTNLERLHVENNVLNGPLLDWLSQLSHLKELFLENNNFSGVIPTTLLNNPSLNFRYSENPYLHTSHRKNKVKVVFGLTIGTVLAMGLVSILYVIYRKINRKKEISEMQTGVHRDYALTKVHNTEKTRVFTLKDMQRATQNFKHKIGEGGFGSVFFGKLDDGKDVAVKVLSSSSKQGAVEFLNEVDLLSRIHHKNLVSLVGYCIESRDLMLVYEHMSGGSLKDHLYGSAADNSKLDWKSRLKIALDAAQGLEYLHIGCTPKIIHRDVKCSNILLDSNRTAKVADFGLSRITRDDGASHVTTTIKGTAGYLDPDYFRTQKLTEKSDVYSFGVVLLEIICGRKPIDAELCEEQLNIIQWVTPYMDTDEDPAKLAEIIDRGLQHSDDDIKSIFHVASLAMKCVESVPSLRPTVSEIVAEIKEAIRFQYTASEDIEMDREGLQANPGLVTVHSYMTENIGSANYSQSLIQEGR